MKILLLGSNGQLGWELQHTCPSNMELCLCDVPQINFCDTSGIAKCIETVKPDCIINAAAYTAVDRAEQEEKLAFQVNHKAVSDISKMCKKQDIFLVHISTDYVFNGKSHRPYRPDDRPEPKSVYGKSKLKGEQAIANTLGDQALIIRTAWLYSSHGNNFVKSMLKLMQEKKKLAIVADQVGTPTWARGLAEAIWNSIGRQLAGTFHWTDAGAASWYDFAFAIQEEALGLGLLDKAIPIQPIPSSAYPTPANRPMYSILDKQSFWEALDREPVHWRIQLKSMLKELYP